MIEELPMSTVFAPALSVDPNRFKPMLIEIGEKRARKDKNKEDGVSAPISNLSLWVLWMTPHDRFATNENAHLN